MRWCVVYIESAAKPGYLETEKYIKCSERMIGQTNGLVWRSLRAADQDKTDGGTVYVYRLVYIIYWRTIS